MNKHLKIFFLILPIIGLIIGYEIYQDSFSKERNDIKEYIGKDARVYSIVGEIFKMTRKKSLYTSKYSMLMYLVEGNITSANIYVYYQKDINNNIIVNKIQIQNSVSGKMYNTKSL